VRYFLSRLPQRWRKIALERLTEPVHLNLFSFFVLLFGSFRMRVACDIVLRPQYAFCLLRAADFAREHRIQRLTAIEFGVASGAGLLNMQLLATRVATATGVEFTIDGFDTGYGMPVPLDYRDHPELYVPGDFPMNIASLQAKLGPSTNLHLGDVAATVPRYLASPRPPIGFVALDVDTYTSTIAAFRLFEGPATDFLPQTIVYVDDIHLPPHNPWAGEMLAIEEFNRTHQFRKLAPWRFLRHERMFKNAAWVDHVYLLHVFDHPLRNEVSRHEKVVIDNPLLGAN
jgi:hypothetical protein